MAAALGFPIRVLSPRCLGRPIKILAMSALSRLPAITQDQDWWQFDSLRADSSVSKTDTQQTNLIPKLKVKGGG
jgi:hypothetical protein